MPDLSKSRMPNTDKYITEKENNIEKRIIVGPDSWVRYDTYIPRKIYGI